MPADPRPDESSLCLSCGLCCAGAFYDLVPLGPDEVEHARGLRLPLLDREPMLTFRLPCPRLVERACTVYAERPRECARFACSLLQDYRGAEVTMDEALGRVREAQAAFAEAGTGVPEAKRRLSEVRRRWFERGGP
jgi:Fe-S-cluster containining protein